MTTPIIDPSGHISAYVLPNQQVVFSDNQIYQTLVTDALEIRQKDLAMARAFEEKRPYTDRGANPINYNYTSSRFSKLLGWQNILAWDAGIDAITIAMSVNTPMYPKWVELEAEFRAELSSQNKIIPYETGRGGWRGDNIGGVQFQQKYNKHGDLLEVGIKLEGQKDLCNRVMRTFGLLSQRCTRLDLQVTIVTKDFQDGNLPYYIKRDRDRRKAAGKPLTPNGFPPKYRLIDNDGGRDGDTFVMGSMLANSRLVAKIYDKQRQGGLEGGYRYEIKLMENYSQDMFEQLLVFYAQTGDPVPSNEYISGAVLGYFRTRYIPVPEINEKSALEIKYKPKETSVQKTINWLIRQVAPAIKDLIERGQKLNDILSHLGLEDELAIALGLIKTRQGIKPKPVPVIDIWLLAMKKAGYGRQIAENLSKYARQKVWAEFDVLLRDHFELIKPLPEYPLDYRPINFVEAV